MLRRASLADRDHTRRFRARSFPGILPQFERSYWCQPALGVPVSIVVAIRPRIMSRGRREGGQSVRIAEQDVRDRELVRTSELVSVSFGPA